jgi:hypothetical protein
VVKISVLNEDVCGCRLVVALKAKEDTAAAGGGRHHHGRRLMWEIWEHQK